MAFIPVPDCIKIEIVMGLDQQIVENVLYYEGANSSDEQVLSDLATNMISQWDAYYAPCVTTHVELLSVRATDQSSEAGPSVEEVPPSGYFGDVAGAAVPNNCAFLLSLKTASRGRSYRGRIYVPGVSSSWVSANAWTSTSNAPFNALISALYFLSANSEPYGLQVVSRYHNGAPRVVGVCTQVTSIVKATTVASQRRRLPGRGT